MSRGPSGRGNLFIRDRMKFLRISQTDLADRMGGYHQTEITRILTGDRGLQFHEAVKLCQILGFSLEALAAYYEGKEQKRGNK